jgi:hypothetical protein
MAIKTDKIEFIDLWNEKYKVRMFFEERPEVPTVPQPVQVPTKIVLKQIGTILPDIPTNIKVGK